MLVHADRLEVGDELGEIVFADLAGKGRHHGCVAGGNLRLGIKDRVPDVSLIGGNDGAVRKRDWAAVNAVELRRSDGSARIMAAAATIAPEQFLALLRKTLLPAFLAEPITIFAWVQDGQPSAHVGMVGATIFRTEQVVTAGAVGTKP